MTLSQNKTDIGDAISLGFPAFNPADATSYYLAAPNGLAGNTVDGDFDIQFPRGGTIKNISISLYAVGLGSAQTSSIYFRLNSTTDTLITSSISTTASVQHFIGTNLNISISQEDKASIRWITPTWTTNPTGVRAT